MYDDDFVNGGGTTPELNNNNTDIQVSTGGNYYQYDKQDTGSEYRGVYSHSNVYPNDFERRGQNSYYGGPQQTGSGQAPKPKKEKKKHPFLGKVAVCLVMGIVFGGFAGISFVAVRGVDNYLNGGNYAAVIPEQDSTQAETDTKTHLAKTSDNGETVVTDVTNVVESVMPSMVSITNKATVQYQDNFFGRSYQEDQESSGSGIIVAESDKELLIVTNYHVVADSKELSVQFIDGESAVAQVKGVDSQADLAVIAIQLDNLTQSTINSITIATLGDSDSLKLGEPAIAIGNALGYGQSVTTGIISAVNREIQMESLDSSGELTSSTLIQTDAAINPGNSGGALLNVNGEVVGINSNKIGGSVIEGMGYAIPINSAIPIIEELMTKETKIQVADSERGYLGISGVSVTNDVSEVYGMPVGVYIAEVYDGTGAADAGILKGDIITSFDGNKVASMEELTALLVYYKKGSTVDVIVMQGSPQGYQEKTISLTLGGKFE